MPQGTLDVHLMNAKGLKNTEFFGKMDPYVIIQCKNQEKRSKVATSQGSKPVWNEKFVFRVTEGVTELKLTIMDKDTAVRDDFVGELRYGSHVCLTGSQDHKLTTLLGEGVDRGSPP
ncbi:hypothetical protein ACLB2K_043573 [Fragaria x ananassa]